MKEWFKRYFENLELELVRCYDLLLILRAQMAEASGSPIQYNWKEWADKLKTLKRRIEFIEEKIVLSSLG